VDDWITEYNKNRPHSGKYCFGKTPMKTFHDSKHLADEKMIDQIFVSKEGFSGSGDRASQLDPDQTSGVQNTAA
jgi:hypothetical protein